MRAWMFGRHADPSRDEESRQAWLAAYREHNRAVREFFATRPGQFLEFDPTREPGWDRLCAFLGAPIPTQPWPHANPDRRRLPWRGLWRRLRRALGLEMRLPVGRHAPRRGFEVTSRADLIAYVHVMKTGGQTMCDILRQSFPGRHCDLQARGAATADDLRFARRFYPRLRSIAGHGVVPLGDLASACDSIRYFVFLRDPVERCVSHYQYRRNKDETSDFEPWLAKHANYQTRFLCRTSDSGETWPVADAARAIDAIERHVGFVGLQERFDESLVLLARWIGDPDFDVAYRARNVASTSAVRRQILGDPRTVEMIRAQHVEDEKLYPPRARRRVPAAGRAVRRERSPPT